MTLKNATLRYKIGIACLILSFLSPVLALFVPFLKLSVHAGVVLSTVFLVGLPEVLFILGAILAGKKIAHAMIQKCKNFFK